MSKTDRAPSVAAGTVAAREWRRQPITVGELTVALQGYDPAMPVVVDGMEGGFDSLTADSISVVDIAVDITDPDKPWWGDHDDAAVKHVLMDDDAGWGGKTTDTRVEGLSGVAEGPALRLSRGDKG